MVANDRKPTAFVGFLFAMVVLRSLIGRLLRDPSSCEDANNTTGCANARGKVRYARQETPLIGERGVEVPCRRQSGLEDAPGTLRNLAEDLRSGIDMETLRKEMSALFLNLAEVKKDIFQDHCEQARLRYIESVESRDPDWSG
jgi:hypothetical protein